MFIETQETPNPHTMKFIPGINLLASGIKSYAKHDDCKSSPLANNLLKINDVMGVFLTPDFITVTKSSGSDWSYLKAIVLACIVDHLASGMPVYIDEASTPSIEKVDQSEIVIQIKELIETRVKPAVEQDGGDIVFNDYKDGIVYVELHGSCSGCPSSTITLKSGIENMLKHYIPEIISVEAV